MDTVTRRRFLLASGVTGAGALAAGGIAYVTSGSLFARAANDPLPGDAHVLVLVTLYGGNDGLNTVIPYADPAYHDARPDIAYTDSEVLKLSDGLGLNPALKGMASLWKQNTLAIVRGVGYPNPDFSHFRSMDIWQTASPSRPVNSGWIGRWLDVSGDDPIRALNVGTVLPPAAVGTKNTAAALDAGGRGQLQPALASAVTGLGVAQSGETASDGVVRRSYRDERTVARTFRPVLDTSAARPRPGNASGGRSGQSSSALKQQLDFVARCVKARVPTRVYLVSLGGFDTHADEKGTQQGLLSVLDEAVSSFLTDMAKDPSGKKVVLAAYSEFGRRVAANASDGTDHGTAGPLFVAGTPVRGGFYGEQPSLTNLDDGNMKATVDFRSVYGELLHRVLGTEPARVLDTVPKAQGFLA